MASYSWKEDQAKQQGATYSPEADKEATAEKTQEIKDQVATAMVAVVGDADALNDPRWRFAATAFKLVANKIIHADKNDSSSQGSKAADEAQGRAVAEESTASDVRAGKIKQSIGAN